MKENNLVQAIIFFIIYMLTSFVLDRLVPGKGLSLKSSLTIGLMVSTVYFMIIAKKSSKEKKEEVNKGK